MSIENEIAAMREGKLASEEFRKSAEMMDIIQRQGASPLPSPSPAAGFDRTRDLMPVVRPEFIRGQN